MTQSGGSAKSIATTAPPAPSRDRMAEVVQMMRELSMQTDPQEMVRAYSRRTSEMSGYDAMVSISRRDLNPPHYRVTRSWRWTKNINPWKQPELLPLYNQGLLGELIYGNEPRIIDDLRLSPSDPAAEHLEGFGSLAFVPMFDRGEAINAAVMLRRQPHAFSHDQFPEMVWVTNLFGRATHNLVLRGQLQDALEEVERELKVVAEIQRSLLPAKMPSIPTLDLAGHYQTARQAGGDYYDFFALPEGRWGILVADVSGHGTPAAVVMAVTHSIAHAYPGPPAPPGELMKFLNRKLTGRRVVGAASFVTAFYGIYDPATRRLTYSSAGHNPPRLRLARDGQIIPLDEAQWLPLGVEAGEEYGDHARTLEPGDRLVLYTDGLTEARGAAGGMFGVEGLDASLAQPSPDAAGMLGRILGDLHAFTQGRSADDDMTMLCVRVV
ncbi:MAG: PP2C family protein-serine/threonine phosphatase [Planctomycetota bacterium]|nr:PP2C family protein-serine/threonine phosphatase [Planctomycetota bacterium]